MTNETSSQNPAEVLQQHFGWSEFREGQLGVVERLLRGDSVLAVFPTGGGKSLCYQLPALMLDGLTVVVSPLIALMKDQIDQLHAKGIAAVRLDSSLSWDEYREAMAQLRSGTAKLLYVAPERFFNERFRSSIEGIKISLFAIDEAHCISQWGHNFRPDYLKLAAVAKKMGVERVLALTATATPTVQQDIRDAFAIQADDAICTEFFRSNLHLKSCVLDQKDRVPHLLDRLKSNSPGSTIVYVSLQKTAVDVANACQAAGLDAQAYHAGMDTDDRSRVQEWFMTEPDKIVVATIAFGMGIDKSDIRYVYHFNPPKSLENYAQEIGRAGRDGQVSQCELLLVPEDRIVLENFVYGDTPSQSSVEQFVREVDRQEDQFFISQIKLGNLCNIKSLVVKTMLTNLELDGHLESTSPRYDSYQFKANVPSSEILSNFEGERKTFAQQLLACAKKKAIWFHLDMSEAIEKLGCDRSRAIRALDYFAEKGWLELRATGLVHGYRKLKPIESAAELAESYFVAAEAREEAEVNRIDQVFQLAQANECQAGTLSSHFGQPLDQPCGVCSFCIGDGSVPFPAVETAPIEPDVLTSLGPLIEKHPVALVDSRSVTRFLCGLRSPAITRAKLSSHKLFGRCGEIPFAEVRQQVESVSKSANRDVPF